MSNYILKLPDIEYSSEDESVKIKLVYIVGRRLHVYPGIGKTWPKHTQCIMYVNGLVQGFGEVVKHELDKDNPSYAFKMATTKALEQLLMKDLRKSLWQIVKKEIKNLEIKSLQLENGNK